ncbi:MAG: hypothetical protein GY953_16895, partial [bacterium]|nr:hypothetical protein [bacterium]
MYRWLLPLLLCGCGIEQQADWQTLYAEAESARRSRELESALARTEQALARLHPDRSAGWHWKFALLRAEIWIDQGNAKQAIEWLDEVPPGALEGALEARWRMHQGWARFRLEDRGAGKWLEEAAELLTPEATSPLAAKLASRLGILASRNRDW